MRVDYKLYAYGPSSHEEDFSFTTFINEINESRGHLLTTFTIKKTLFISFATYFGLSPRITFF